MVALGFDGTVREQGVSEIQALYTRPAVFTPSSWRPVPVSGQRSVSFAAGSGGMGFLRDTTPSATILPIPAPISAGRWYLLVRRFDWKLNTGVFMALPHSVTTTDAPTAEPLTLPGTLQSAHGILADMVLGWAWTEISSTVVRIFDWRQGPPTDMVESDDFAVAIESGAPILPGASTGVASISKTLNYRSRVTVKGSAYLEFVTPSAPYAGTFRVLDGVRGKHSRRWHSHTKPRADTRYVDVEATFNANAGEHQFLISLTTDQNTEAIEIWDVDMEVTVW